MATSRALKEVTYCRESGSVKKPQGVTGKK